MLCTPKGANPGQKNNFLCGTAMKTLPSADPAAVSGLKINPTQEKSKPKLQITWHATHKPVSQ